jgi:hypothetical protein
LTEAVGSNTTSATANANVTTQPSLMIFIGQISKKVVFSEIGSPTSLQKICGVSAQT